MLKPIVTDGPWTTVAMDLAGPFPFGADSERYVLVIMDHFTKFVILVALKSKRAALVARKVHKRLLCLVGCPRTIITDNGTEFKGEFDELCAEWCINHACVLPYHQQANGLVERYMQSVNKMVRIVTEERKETWARSLNTHAFAYNASFHRAILNTPYFLNFGRDPHIPIDNRLRGDESVRLREFSREKAVETAQIMEWTALRLKEYQADMKARYDALQRGTHVQIGDVVFVRNEGMLPKSAMRWSRACRVTKVDMEGLRITVKPMYGDGPIETVSVQRVRPYSPSELNPLTPLSVPRSGSNLPPPVEVLTHPDSEIGSVALPDVCESVTVGESLCGSREALSVRQRDSSNLAAGGSARCNGDIVISSEDNLDDVRRSHRQEVSSVTISPLPLTVGDRPCEARSPRVCSSDVEATASTLSNIGAVTQPEVGVRPAVVDSAVGVQNVLNGDHFSEKGEKCCGFTQDVEPADPDEGDDIPDGEYAIDSLVGHKHRKGYRYYRVRWEGCGSDEDTWEPAYNLPDKLVRSYMEEHLPDARI